MDNTLAIGIAQACDMFDADLRANNGIVAKACTHLTVEDCERISELTGYITVDGFIQPTLI